MKKDNLIQYNDVQSKLTKLLRKVSVFYYCFLNISFSLIKCKIAPYLSHVILSQATTS